MRVRATQKQTYGERYHNIGDVFDVRDEDFTPSCMRKVGADAATLADNPDRPRLQPISLSELSRGEGSLEGGRGEDQILNGKPVGKGKGKGKGKQEIIVDGKPARVVEPDVADDLHDDDGKEDES